MDIRNDDGSQVVTNIMMKKRPLIEAESQIEVPENQQQAMIEKERILRIQKKEAKQKNIFIPFYPFSS